MSELLQPGTRLGRYRLGVLVGEGGMGRVYRATDESLHRDVAVKVIHAALSRDGSAAARFEREALAVAALSHPNIVALHDAGSHEGTPYAVMELLEGETLRAKLASGPLPPRKAVEYGGQIARALAAAHGRGILHRDVKPDNVFITRDGHVKVLDFGLAVLNDAAVAFDGATHAASTPGLILGTPGYMAPEQLRGGVVDERTDIFALGAVLYEMLSGRRAFHGTSHADVVSAILQSDPPDIADTGTSVPPVLERVVRRCLEKNPDDRFHAARDVAFALEAVGSSTTSGAVAAAAEPRRSYAPIAAVVAAAVIGTAAFVAGRLMRPTPPDDVPAARFTLLANTALIPDVAVSPDGRFLAWTALPTTERGADASTTLWIRSLDSTEIRGIPATNTAVNPVFSADSRELWFIEGNLLSAADVDSSRRRTIMEVPGERVRPGRGFALNLAGDLLLPLDTGITLRRAGTSALVPLTTVDGSREISHRWPVFLPDGSRYVYLANLRDGSNETRVASLEGGAASTLPLPPGVTRVMIDPAGYVLYGEGAGLFAQAIDFSTLTLEGRTARITETLLTGGFAGWIPTAVSATGVLAYREAPERMFQFEWIDRSGASLGRLGTEDAFNNFDLSPDGSRMVVVRRNVREGNSLHVFDTVRGSSMIIANTGRESTLSDPTWSADGRRVAYRNGNRLMVRDASGANERVLAETAMYPDSWSPDGQWLLVGYGRENGYVLTAVSTDGSGKLIPIGEESRIVDEPKFSPDGKWILYHAAPDRRPEVFLQPFPPTGEKWQMSIEGGVQPRWRHDGKEFFFIDTGGRLVAVDVPEGNPRAVGRPRVLADLRLSPSTALDQYSPSPDGSKFLVRRPAGTGAETIPVQVLVNWRAMFPELRER